MRAKICASITVDDLKYIKKVEPLVDLYEVRIDLIGDGWQFLVKKLKKPWLACNRSGSEGGQWKSTEAKRLAALFEAAELGAAIVDIELDSPDLKEVVKRLEKKTDLLISKHIFQNTPGLSELKKIMNQQKNAGAKLCKIVTTANNVEDNQTLLKLVSQEKETRLICFAMGQLGLISRILSPLAGAEFTYASVGAGNEAAPGQLPVRDLRNIYDMVTVCKK